MKGVGLLASVVGAIGSLLTIIILLWKIAASTTLLTYTVEENKKLLTALPHEMTQMRQELDTINEYNTHTLKVEYVNDNHMILRVPDGYGKHLVEVPMKVR